MNIVIFIIIFYSVVVRFHPQPIPSIREHPKNHTLLYVNKF